MFEKFTDRARKVFALANLEAQRFNHEYFGITHDGGGKDKPVWAVRIK